MAIELKDYHDNQPDLLFEQFSRTPPVFSAPEMFTVKKRYSYAVDIWSLGCLIFNMVTGIPPFYESDSSALKNSIQHGQYTGYFPEFDSNASEELRTLIQQMILLNSLKRCDCDYLMNNPWINSAH